MLTYSIDKSWVQKILLRDFVRKKALFLDLFFVLKQNSSDGINCTSVDFPKNKELDPTRGASKLNQIYHKLRSGLAWILNAGELPKCLSSTFCRPDMVVIRAANDVDRLLPKTGSECAIDEPWAVGESLSSDGGMKTREWSFLCE